MGQEKPSLEVGRSPEPQGKYHTLSELIDAGIKTKILFVADGASISHLTGEILPQGGVEVTVRNVYEQLEALGIEVLMVTPDYFRHHWGPKEAQGLELTFDAHFQMERIIRDFQPDAILNYNPEGSVGRALSGAARKISHGSPEPIHTPTTGIFTTMFDHMVEKTVEGWLRERGISEELNQFTIAILHGLVTAWMRRSFNNPDRVLIGLSSMRRQLAERGVSPEKGRWPEDEWPRGVSDKFEPLKENEPNYFHNKQSFPTIKEGHKVVVMVGRLSAEKNPEIMVQMARLARQRPDFQNIHFVLVGNGPLQESLQAKIDRLGLADWVHITGKLSQDEVARAYRSADAAINANDQEAWSHAVSESTRSGTPIVTIKGPGAGERITPDIGVVVEGGTESFLDGLSNALKMDHQFVAEAAKRIILTWAQSIRVLIEKMELTKWGMDKLTQAQNLSSAA